MAYLLKQGIEKEKIFYMNFEDERLHPFAKSDFDLLFESFYLNNRMCLLWFRFAVILLND